MVVLQTSDFSNNDFFQVAQNPKLTPKLQAAINEWEKHYIYAILSNNYPAYAIGYGDVFINDCSANNGVPIIARNVQIFNPMVVQDGRRVRQSKGMKYVLQALVFYHYVTAWAASLGQGGVGSSNMDTQNKADYINVYRFAEQRWNAALDSIETIQWWLKTGNGTGGGATEYPEFIMPHHIQPKFSDIL